MSVRTQIYLNEEQARLLKLKAEKLKVPMSELIRQGVDWVLAAKDKGGNDPLLKMVGSIRGGKKDSISLDKVLYGK